MEMQEILTKLKHKLSIKFLLFIIIIIIGCSYQIIQLVQVYFEFETKINVKYNENNEIVIPMVSFCQKTDFMFRNSSQHINEMSPAQVYNQTLSFNEVFIEIEFIRSNGKYEYSIIDNFKDEEQNNGEIYYEKTISSKIICYHFKYLHSKQLKRKQRTIYKFQLYHQNYGTFIINFPYSLFLTSDVNYPNVQKDNLILIYGNIFFSLTKNIKCYI